MTVNSCTLMVFLMLFIESVVNIQNEFQQGTFARQTCAYPYSCISTGECAERHATHGIDEVLFYCLGKQKVCCPPNSLQSAFVTQPNVYTTTERDVGCAQCSFDVNKPQGQVKPSESRRPSIQPVEGRRPVSSQQAVTNRPQTSQSVENRPQSSQFVPNRPQTPQSSQSVENRPQSSQFAPNRPQTPQSSQSVENRPQSSQFVPNRPQTPQSSQSAPNRPQIPQSQPAVNRPQTPQSSQSAPNRPQNPQPLQSTASRPQSPITSLKSHRNYRLLPSESNCGVNNFANRITEGEEVSLGEYPWMVLTGLKDKYNNYRWNCGGTLINGWYVLTAAHCLIVDNRTIEYVRLGEHNLTNDTDCYLEVCLDPPEDIRIAEIIPHEKWNTTTIKNDIALLRLSRNALTTGKSNIYPICLPFNPQKLNLTSSTKYEVAGWGKTDWNADEGSEVLRKASISGVSREECNICKDKKKQQYCPIVDTQLCIQGWKSVDVCKGDSGGPLMVTRLNIYQIGITSFKGSEYCGAENIPSIFTKVQSYLPWILDNIRE